jgi:hypothetical protein
LDEVPTASLYRRTACFVAPSNAPPAGVTDAVVDADEPAAMTLQQHRVWSMPLLAGDA